MIFLEILVVKLIGGHGYVYPMPNIWELKVIETRKKNKVYCETYYYSLYEIEKSRNKNFSVNGQVDSNNLYESFSKLYYQCLL